MGDAVPDEAIADAGTNAHIRRECPIGTAGTQVMALGDPRPRERRSRIVTGAMCPNRKAQSSVRRCGTTLWVVTRPSQSTSSGTPIPIPRTSMWRRRAQARALLASVAAAVSTASPRPPAWEPTRDTRRGPRAPGREQQRSSSHRRRCRWPRSRPSLPLSCAHFVPRLTYVHSRIRFRVALLVGTNRHPPLTAYVS